MGIIVMEIIRITVTTTINLTGEEKINTSITEERMMTMTVMTGGEEETMKEAGVMTMKEVMEEVMEESNRDDT